jgi:hypothetical protein
VKRKLQWNAFRKKLKQIHSPENLNDVISVIQKFLTPVIDGLRSGKKCLKNGIPVHGNKGQFFAGAKLSYETLTGFPVFADA